MGDWGKEIIMLGTLLKKELAGLGNTLTTSGKNSGRNRSNSLRTKLLLGFVAVYMFGFMGFLFYSLADKFCEPFVMMGIEWAYFAIMGVLSLTFCIIGGAMTAYSTIYKAKDNEFLLSLPIRPSLILSTRVFICYALDFVINAIITVVAFVVYEMYFSLTVPMIIGGIIVLLVFPLFGLVLSLLLGWLIGIATSKVPEEKKSYVSLAFVLVFMVGYFILYGKMMDIMEIIVNSKDAVAGFLEKYVKPVFWMGNAATGDPVSIVLLAVVSVAAFALVYMILSASFIKVITTTKGRKKIKYKEQQLKSTDVGGALLGREFLRFRRNTTIMVNFGFGLVMLVVMGIGLIAFSGKIGDMLSSFGVGQTDVWMLAGMGALLYVLSAIPITAPSISLEASTLWLIRSLPISTWDIRSSKLKEHLYLTIPATMIAMAGIIVATKPSVLSAVLGVLCIIVYNLFMATWGLRLGVTKPSFNWTTDAAVVKRSASVTLCMLASMGIVMTLCVLYVAFGEKISTEIFIGGVTVILGAVSFMNYRWLRTKGVEIFENL